MTGSVGKLHGRLDHEARFSTWMKVAGGSVAMARAIIGFLFVKAIARR